MSASVQVHAFPRSDKTFVSFVEDAITSSRTVDPDALAARVQTAYPLARIVPQSSLGTLGGPLIWYAYRDGTLIPDESLPVMQTHDRPR